MRKIIEDFLKYLSIHGVSSNSLKYYKSDLVNFLNWTGSKQINQELIQIYIEEKRLTTPTSTLKRRLSTLRSFGNFLGIKKPIKSWQDGILQRFVKKPKLQNLLYKLFFNRPNWYRRYHSYPLANYLHIAILVIFSSLSAYALYDQVFRQATPSSAFPTALTRPNRYLSFQGRLTSNLGNPITIATNVVFKLHTASSGGSELWSSGICSITPDSDGIFSTLLGSSCGAEIASSVFSENASVWVSVTVGADSEATPRIQIATVAYALNAETLQGYPAGTGTSTIPYLNSSGELVIAAASPKLQSTSGTFAVEGVALTITTPNTSNGVITVNPDGTGTLNLTFEGAAAGGAVNGFVNATNANITSGALYGGTVASAVSGYNFIDFQSGVSPTSKFSVSAVGNTTMAGDLTITGDDLFMTTNTANYFLMADGTNYNPTSPADARTGLGLGAGGTGDIWVEKAGDTMTGALTNTLATGNSLVWDTNTLIVNATNDRVGIGTTGPDAKLDSLATTEQLRLTYTDGTVYSSFTTDSNGDLTIAPSGGDLSLTGNLTTTGTTGLTFTGVGGDITFTNGEKIDNDTNGTLALTATTTSLSGNLKLIGKNILDSAGTSMISFAVDPTAIDSYNVLTYGSWKVENPSTGNPGIAALIVNQTKAGDIFTATSSATTKFTIENDGDVNIVSGDITIGGGNVNTGNIAFVVGDGTTDGISFTTDGTGNGEYTFSVDGIGDADLDWGTGAGQIDVTDVENGSVNILLETEIDTSSELLAIMDNETGTGALVFANTPTLVTPIIGLATGTSLDLGATTLYGSRAITVDTGGVLNINLASAAGDDFTVDTNKLVVKGDTGNVGIGTTGPASTLHVASAGTREGLSTSAVFSDSTDETEAVFIGFNSTLDYGLIAASDLSTAWKNLVLQPTGGNVGIGTATPGKKLDISGGQLRLTEGTANRYALLYEDGLHFTRSSDGVETGNIDYDGVDQITYNSAGGGTGVRHLWQVNSGDVMAIDNSGNVGIGDTTPAALFTVGNNDLFRVNSSGAIAAATGITSSGNITFSAATAGTEVGNACFASGGLLLNEADDVCDVSSIRYKENISDINYGLEEIMKMRPISFRHKIDFDPTDRRQKIGFLAEEMNLIVPEVVTYDNDGVTPNGIDYAKLTSLLTKGMQELQTEIISLSSQITINEVGDLATATFAKIKARIGNFKQLETNLISPITNSDLVIDLQPDNNQVASEFVIKGENDEVVTSFDGQGNATISGTLYANNIESDKIKAIEDLLNEVENNQALLAQTSNWNTDTATTSGELIAYSLQTTELFVTGQSVMSNLFISDSLTADTLNSLDSPLAIQSLALNPLEIMAGKIKIDTDGNVYFSGNVEIAGDLIVSNIVVASNSAVSGESEPTPEALNNEITTNSIAGKAILPAGQLEIKINNSKLKVDSLIYVTPVSSTENKVLYVKSKDVGKFTIGFNEPPLDTDVEFNWWIIELKNDII
ncbi:MAG: Complement C1q protein [Candidatus Woesebacteria bacterium GW2011_GWA1_33_30]|uniref:Complement C1q protein n=1 Tax=Candidatus Woesebacteria bacterium GW2011_GWA2_33_28 TaxID=1618561 RepID=A0A0F9ZQA7_9BACT|nr:MAG: Complement C1q protein [Candidatus Woesebacteria bacterium GW2011_GWA2_33_28]KKP46930.1 MAG: Complement C1q protein [Candidatus Woesebacteria bacterium GW2011_GWA1_33_30]KKP48660.1 MAG: Complement C1q protein [Microgenomates group bacterium GW2011_GWC1_33_32]KKP51349.1 MAG: Complement C1q protein [Candidatus Woesebacteria bacterium GW2011_GWB1_33_38]KKP57280.1 MAG: Complement C1q protein [Microgenomates group bacterium GW2011_GWD1_33_9]